MFEAAASSCRLDSIVFENPMATLTAIEGYTLFYNDNSGQEQAYDTNALMDEKIKPLQDQIDVLSSGLPPLTNIDGGTF